MKVAVTGARGGVGRHVVYDLLAHGYDVKAICRRHWDNAPAEVEQVSGIDMTDFEAVKREFAGCDAVIHVANLPGPSEEDADPSVFTNNMNANYNVMLACGLLGIKRLVVTSSVCAMGHVYGSSFPGFTAFPIEETDTIYPGDSYGISKKFTEELGECMCRRFPGMHIAFLRITRTMLPEEYDSIAASENWLASYTDNEKNKAWHWRHNMATYVDARDSARAHVLAMEKTPEGSNVYYICAPDSSSLTPTAEYLAKAHPDVPVKWPLSKWEAAECSKKANDILGWQNEYWFWDELAKAAQRIGRNLPIPEGRRIP